MELLFILAALVLLSVFALRFGYDSRTNLQSKEQELASFGMRWDVAGTHAADLRREVAQERLVRLATAAQRRRPVRRAAAQVLRAVAARLSPELTQTTGIALRRL